MPHSRSSSFQPFPLRGVTMPNQSSSQTIRLARRGGFTLVEILVVIVIIGILAAIAIPAVNQAVTRGKNAAMKLEVNGLDQAVNQYNDRYGDFPPDFSSFAIVQSHYRKAFPRIGLNDSRLLFFLLHDSGIFQAARMDRAEALVWALNGFSDNVQRPFTGPGGPLVWVGDGSNNYTDASVTDAERQDPTNFQISNDHPNALFEFDPGRLTISEVDASAPLTGSNRYGSTDEPMPAERDLFPTYLSNDEKGPYVYFDARTYDVFDPVINDFNGYGSTDFGFVRPYRSTQVINNTTGTEYANAAAASDAYQFMLADSFQIVAPGLDGIFGSFPSTASNAPIYFIYPTGQAIALEGGSGNRNPGDLLVNEVRGYQEASAFGGVDNFQRDNITNFSNAVIADEVE